MPDGQQVNHYMATVLCDTDGLFEPMSATVAIPVRRPR